MANRYWHMRKHKKFMTYFVVTPMIILTLLGGLLLLNPDSALSIAISGHLKNALESKLQIEIPVPPESRLDDGKNHRIIYVLGGDFNALAERFRVAASLLKKGLCDKVSVADMSKWHIYSSVHGKNLSFEQWVIYKLGQYGIGKDRIEFIKMERGFWGTKSEAVSFIRFLSHTSYKEIVLVTSAYHTRRAYLIFRKLIKPQNLPVYIYGSNAKWRLSYLLLEVPKLFIYKYLF